MLALPLALTLALPRAGAGAVQIAKVPPPLPPYTMIDKKYSDNLRKSISDTMSFTKELHNHKLRSVSTLIQYYYGTIWPTFLISSRSAFGCKYCSHSSGQALN